MHLVYGPHGTRGDGTHTRSSLRIDDGIDRLLRIDVASPTPPLNLGSSELVTINRLAEMAEFAPLT